MRFIRKNGRVIPVKDSGSTCGQKVGRIAKGSAKDATTALIGSTVFNKMVMKHSFGSALKGSLGFSAAIGAISAGIRTVGAASRSSKPRGVGNYGAKLVKTDTEKALNKGMNTQRKFNP